MKLNLLYFFTLSVFFSCKGPEKELSELAPAASKLIWSEEFNYNGLPDSSKWVFDEGFIRPKEAQYFTRARKENIGVDQGVLTITGRKEQYPNKFYQEGSTNLSFSRETAEYTSASIRTYGKYSWDNIRVEIKAKLPRGGGMWPAFWMMGANIKTVGWPQCGEIDIMEHIGKKDSTTIFGTVHYGQKGQPQTSFGKTIQGANLYDEFHTYAMEKNQDSISIFFDDKRYMTFSIINLDEQSKEIFRKPFFLIMNLSMGADWPGPIEDAALPSRLIVDYIRIYEKN